MSSTLATFPGSRMPFGFRPEPTLASAACSDQEPRKLLSASPAGGVPTLRTTLAIPVKSKLSGYKVPPIISVNGAGSDGCALEALLRLAASAGATVTLTEMPSSVIVLKYGNMLRAMEKLRACVAGVPCGGRKAYQALPNAWRRVRESVVS